jgi:hypothetical protein
MARANCRLGDRWAPPAQHIDTEERMRRRIEDTGNLHRHIYDDGLVRGIQIGLVAGALLALIAWGIAWL